MPAQTKSKLVRAKNSKFFNICPDCGVRFKMHAWMWLWFDGNKWLHPDCWRTRRNLRDEGDVFAASCNRVGILMTLSNMDVEWADAQEYEEHRDAT